MKRILAFFGISIAAFCAAAPLYNKPTYNQAERLIGAVKEVHGDPAAYTAALYRTSTVYSQPTYDQIERLISEIREGTNVVDSPIGRYLSIWNCETGLPLDSMRSIAYAKGDIYVVGNTTTNTPTDMTFRHTITLHGPAAGNPSTVCTNVVFHFTNSVSTAYEDVVSVATAIKGYVLKDGIPATGTVIRPLETRDISFVSSILYLGNYELGVSSQDGGSPIHECSITNTSYFSDAVSVESVTAASAYNRRPSGASYSYGTPSSDVEFDLVVPGNVYWYDGSMWKLIRADYVTSMQATNIVTSKLAGIHVNGQPLTNDVNILSTGKFPPGTDLSDPVSTLKFCHSIATNKTVVAGMIYYGQPVLAEAIDDEFPGGGEVTVRCLHADRNNPDPRDNVDSEGCVVLMLERTSTNTGMRHWMCAYEYFNFDHWLHEYYPDGMPSYGTTNMPWYGIMYRPLDGQNDGHAPLDIKYTAASLLDITNAVGNITVTTLGAQPKLTVDAPVVTGMAGGNVDTSLPITSSVDNIPDPTHTNRLVSSKGVADAMTSAATELIREGSNTVIKMTGIHQGERTMNPQYDKGIWKPAAVAPTNCTVEIGVNAHATEVASSSQSIAIGRDALSVGSATVAVGPNSFAEGAQAVALGWRANAVGAHSVSIGSAKKSGNDYYTNGTVSTTSDLNLAEGDYSIAIGYNVKAKAKNAIAFGNDSAAEAIGAVQLGYGTNNVAHTLQFEDVTIVKDGQVVGTAFKEPETIDPTTYPGQEEMSITVKPGTMTTVIPSYPCGPGSEIEIHSTSSRNFTLYFANTAELREGLPIYFEFGTPSAMSRVTLSTNVTTRLPIRFKSEQPYGGLTVIEPTPMDDGYDWKPSITNVNIVFKLSENKFRCRDGVQASIQGTCLHAGTNYKMTYQKQGGGTHTVDLKAVDAGKAFMDGTFFGYADAVEYTVTTETAPPATGNPIPATILYATEYGSVSTNVLIDVITD